MAGAAVMSRTQARGRRQQHQTLPFDLIVDIAARTDPATLVRCAATCVDMRCRVRDDPGLRGRLRLRHGDRFVLPLLRGHMFHRYLYQGSNKRKEELFLMDTNALSTTRLRRISGFDGFHLAARDGLVLARVDRELRVCDPATGRSQTLPSEPVFPMGVVARQQDKVETNYVLLIGEEDEGATAVGHHFNVVMAYLEVAKHRRHLQLQTYSSEHGTWGHSTEIRVPNLQGSRLVRGLGRALVVGSALHWLCETDKRSYILKHHVGGAHVTTTMLPESFSRSASHHQLLAMSSVGGNLIVLVGDGRKILAWVQSKQTTKWQQQPQVLIETEAISRFLDKLGKSRLRPGQLNPVWFAERSGIVLISSCCGFFWLDLQLMEIVRWFSDHGLQNMIENIPYEMNLAAWVPTFSSNL